MDDRSREFWTPEPLFKGETVFCLASGPSLTQGTVDRLRGRRVAVVNSTVMLAPWADLLFFTDSGWYEPRREIVKSFAGLVVSMSPTAKRELPDRVKRVKGEGDPGFPVRPFPPLGSPVVQQGRSSGHTVISILIAMAAKRIVLLGYDMRIVDGREHHHQEYQGPRDLGQYARDFVPTFNGWNAAALAAGTVIVNCTPESAVTEFPFADLDEVLTCAQS